MKKEYHYTISRTDRICLVSFVIFLLSWELIKGLFPGDSNDYQYVAKPKETYVDYKSNYKKNNYPKKYAPKKYSNKYDHRYSEKKSFPKSTPPGQPLSIMSASINELTSMGFSAKVAFNIHKYISSGGILSTPADLMKIYGMDSLQLMKASPYIIYAPQKSMAKDFFKKDLRPASKHEIIDLNIATVAELESLNGIGNVLAERIIKFRESMGGFIHPDQLKDCYGITPEFFDQLKPQLQVSGAHKKIEVNKSDVTTVSHPYLSKKMARLIKAYQDQHGPLTSESELKKVYPADSNWFNKILPYLSFE